MWHRHFSRCRTPLPRTTILRLTNGGNGCRFKPGDLEPGRRCTVAQLWYRARADAQRPGDSRFRHPAAVAIKVGTPCARHHRRYLLTAITDEERARNVSTAGAADLRAAPTMSGVISFITRCSTSRSAGRGCSRLRNDTDTLWIDAMNVQGAARQAFSGSPFTDMIALRSATKPPPILSRITLPAVAAATPRSRSGSKIRRPAGKTITPLLSDANYANLPALTASPWARVRLPSGAVTTSHNRAFATPAAPMPAPFVPVPRHQSRGQNVWHQ